MKWLQDYQLLETEIAWLEDNLERTEKELKRWVDGDLRHVKLQSDSQGAQVEDFIERIKSELDYKMEQRAKLVEFVSNFKSLDAQILRFKYVDGMTLEEIAEQLGYSNSHINKQHAKLIKQMKKNKQS